MGINEEGFLSPDIEGYRIRIRQRNAAYFDLIERLNRFCHDNKFRFNVHSQDGQEVFALGLFFKLMADVQAAVILIEKGMVSQARSLLRVAVECLIRLAKICQGYEFVAAYVRIGERQLLKMVNSIRNNRSLAFQDLKPELTEELVNTIAATAGSADESIAQWAKDVGLSHLYDSDYRLLSGDAHSNPNSLEQYLVFSENGDLVDMQWGPNTEQDLRPELIEVAHIMWRGMSYMDILFKLNLEHQMKTFLTEVNGLDKPQTGG